MNDLKFSGHVFSHVETASFDVRDYSRMKFGSDQSARRLGDELAIRFYGEHGDRLAQARSVIIPAPGSVVPVASTLLSVHLMNRLNHFLVQEGGGVDVLDWTMVHRNLSYQQDYHFLDAQMRRDLLDGDELFLNKEFIRDKQLIFIDDVVITGAHEAKLAKYLDAHQITNPRIFVSYARYDGDDPTIEARLNHSAIKTGADVFALARLESDHRMTTRAIRLILEMPEGALRDSLSVAARATIEAAYYAAINKGYHKQYPENFAQIASLVRDFFA